MVLLLCPPAAWMWRWSAQAPVGAPSRGAARTRALFWAKARSKATRSYAATIAGDFRSSRASVMADRAVWRRVRPSSGRTSFLSTRPGWSQRPRNPPASDRWMNSRGPSRARLSATCIRSISRRPTSFLRAGQDNMARRSSSTADRLASSRRATPRWSTRCCWLGRTRSGAARGPTRLSRKSASRACSTPKAPPGARSASWRWRRLRNEV